MSFNEYFIKVSQASILFPLIAGVIVYKRIPHTFKVLAWFFFFTLLVEVSASLLKKYFHNNMPLLHVFTFFEFTVYVYVYSKYFNKNKKVGNAILLFFSIYLFLAILDAFVLNGYMKANSNSRTFESMILTLLSLMYYYHFFKENQEKLVWREPMFWFSTGILFYFSINLFFFMLENVMIISNYNLADKGIDMHSLINIFANMIFAASFLCYRKIKA